MAVGRGGVWGRLLCALWSVPSGASLYDWFCLSDVALTAVDLRGTGHGQGAGGMAMRAEDM